MVNSEAITLEAEMKLLQWHKLANESALKAAIIKNKAMKRKEKAMLRLPFDINARLNEVIQEERSKEIVVANEAFVNRYRQVEQIDEMSERRRFTVQAKRLDILQKKLQNLDSNRSRKLRCSSIKSLLHSEPENEKINSLLHQDIDINEVESEDEIESPPAEDVHRSKSIDQRVSKISKDLSRPSTVEKTKVRFSQYRPKTHESEPSGMLYNVRISNDSVQDF